MAGGRGHHGPAGEHTSAKYTAGLALGALGVVYGDIGTSPIYALREAFHGDRLTPDRTNVFGALSIIFWAMVIIVTIKYLTFVMKASNQGEGGILALTSLIRSEPEAGDTDRSPRRSKYVLVLLGLFGTAMLYGDGMITPAISVLSAVEGLEVRTSAVDGWVVPIAVAILIGLFSIQRFGTGRVGAVFGPIMILWFSVLAVLGVVKIFDEPAILQAMNPLWAARYFGHEPWDAFVSMGSLFLVVTGGEALYADMGHFGRKPIALGWYFVVFPALLLNYFGQGAHALVNPSTVKNPFYLMTPDWALLPVVVLAMMATVIASQALISGVFSLTQQAMQLGYAPRGRISYTSSTEKGQVYISHINWGLMLACVALVIGFGSSTNLAAAYGLAVTATMVVTALIFGHVARAQWGWSRLRTYLLVGLFLVVDALFLGANILKIPKGGWFPLVVAAVIFTLLTTGSAGAVSRCGSTPSRWPRATGAWCERRERPCSCFPNLG
jgi:KUP system potassium uptake protein